MAKPKKNTATTYYQDLDLTNHRRSIYKSSLKQPWCETSIFKTMKFSFVLQLNLYFYQLSKRHHSPTSITPEKNIFPYSERSETMASSMQSLQAFSWFLIHGCSKAWGAVILWSGSTTSSFFTKSEAKEDLQKYPVKYWWFGDETLRICVEKWDWSQDLSLSAGGPSRTNPQKKNALRRVSYPCVS